MKRFVAVPASFLIAGVKLGFWLNRDENSLFRVYFFVGSIEVDILPFFASLSVIIVFEGYNLLELKAVVAPNRVFSNRLDAVLTPKRLFLNGFF